MASFLELAKERRSVRSFDGTMPEKAVLDQLKEYAEIITNPYGVKVRFVFLDAKEHKLSSPVLTGERVYVSAIVEKAEHAEEGYGYSFEKFIIKAQELGLGNVWIGGTMPREKFESAAELAENELMPCISPLGTPAKKMSIKETLMRKGVKADTRKNFEELFFEGDFSKALTEASAKEKGLFDALEAVRVAPSAVNKQPWRIVIDGNKAHFYERHDKGFLTPDYDVQKIDIGIALFHFESQMLCENKELKLTVEDPGISMPEGLDYVATFEM